MSQEITSYVPPLSDVIVVEQLPVIREQLEVIKNDIIGQVNDALSLDCTEATVKEVKAVRAQLKKDFDLLEQKRKEVKKAILSPYESFEEIYKECISSVYAPADGKLKAKIDEVENGLKAEKRNEIKLYFDEYCKSKGIDFLSFEKTGITVNLSASKKSLKERAKAFVDKVDEEVRFISSQDNTAEILLEYRKTLNAVQALNTVAERHKALESEQARLQQAIAFHEALETKSQATEKEAQENMISDEYPVIKPLPPIEIPFPTPIEKKQETILVTTFTVRGTKEKLLALRKFLIDGDYNFE